jgi:FixJ family two-component response regulator
MPLAKEPKIALNPKNTDLDTLIYVVDDDQAMCESLSWLLQSMHWQVETYNNADSFLKHYDSNKLSCLILDVRMPGMSGLALQETLQNQHIDIPVIFITGHGDIKMAVRAMKAGAMEFLNKPFNDQELLDSIHRSLNLAKENRQKTEERKYIYDRLDTLTARERQILQLLVKGKMNKVIAYDLKLSIKTIELHRSNIMRKFKSPTMTALLSLLYQHHVDLNDING